MSANATSTGRGRPAANPNETNMQRLVRMSAGEGETLGRVDSAVNAINRVSNLAPLIHEVAKENSVDVVAIVNQYKEVLKNALIDCFAKLDSGTTVKKSGFELKL